VRLPVRLRPNRGFPLGLAQQCHPHVHSDYLIISRRLNKIRRICHFCLKLPNGYA
jgi:hypothetical protein